MIQCYHSAQIARVHNDYYIIIIPRRPSQMYRCIINRKFQSVGVFCMYVRVYLLLNLIMKH